MQVRCPRCSTSNTLNEAEADAEGRVRTRCTECDAKLLVKVNKPALRVSSEIPKEVIKETIAEAALRREHEMMSEITSGPLPILDDEPVAQRLATSKVQIDREPGEQLGTEEVVVTSLPERRMSDLRRWAFMIPHLGANPNKLAATLASLPYRFPGLSPAEAEELCEKVRGWGGTVGPDALPVVEPDPPALDVVSIPIEAAPPIPVSTLQVWPTPFRTIGLVTLTVPQGDDPQDALDGGWSFLARQAGEAGAIALLGACVSVGDGLMVLQATSIAPLE